MSTDENLKIFSSSSSNQFRVSTILYGIDPLIREVFWTQKTRKNTQTQNLDLKVSLIGFGIVCVSILSGNSV